MCVPVPVFCAFFFGVVVVLLILQLFEYNFNAIMNSMVEQLPYLDFVHSLDHKVDKGISVLLYNSFNVGCHGTAPRFKVCVFLQMFAYTLLQS
jgi:hypothetical protein